MSAGTRPAPVVPGPVAGPPRRRVPQAVVVLLTAAAVLLAATIAVVTVLAPHPAVGTGSRVVVVGDSYSSGTAQGGLGGSNWTAVLADRRGWELTDTAIPGTGYLRARPYAGTFAAAQLDGALALQPELVVVQGSLNDGDLPPALVGAAAAALYADVHARAPGARLVVIGPAWPGDVPPPGLVAVRDAVGEAARAAGAVWIDPMTEGWFTGPQGAALIGADALHPTDAGHRLMADRTADALARAIL